MMIGGRGWRRGRRRSRHEPLGMGAVLVPVAHGVVRVKGCVQVRMSAAHAAAESTGAESALRAVQRFHHVAHHAAQRQARAPALLLLTLGGELAVSRLDALLLHC